MALVGFLKPVKPFYRVNMAVVNAFLTQFHPPAVITKLCGAALPPKAGKVLCVDFPVKETDKFIAHALLRMHYENYGGFSLVVANEGAAIVGALLVAGYKFMEIIEMAASGRLDVTTLVEGGQKLPDLLHKKKSGAMHKGHRLRDRINELLREKVPGDPSARVTFNELFVARRNKLVITALDLAAGGVVPLSVDSFPSMPVADAVIASCAVQPYIAAVEFKDGEKKKFKFLACTQVQSLPLDTLAQEFKMAKASGALETALVGFGYKGTDNVAGSANATGDELYRVLLAQRAKAVVPQSMKNNVILI